MGIDPVEREIEAAQAGTGDQDAERAFQLRSGRDDLRDRVRGYVEKQLGLFTANTGRRLREEQIGRASCRERVFLRV